MSFITFEKGSRAKILRKGDFYYNQDYFPVVAQHQKTGQVMLQLPSGRRVYAANELKKYVGPPGSLPAPQANEEKSDEQKAMTDFFFPKNKTENLCPLCGQSGNPGFREFKCNNPTCGNN